MTVKKKKSAKEKRVLIASLIVAGVIVAGSTFAWFTSKDEVTNRLSASANYGVSIAEDFQPPEDWVPGQTINKDVSAVNTGNVDAFVRMWFGGQMKVINEDATGAPDATTNADEGLTAVTDQRMLDLGLTYSKDNKYYKTLSTEQRKNPELNGTSNSEETNDPATFSEVQAVQAGGYLVYAPANAAYKWTLEQATTMSVNGTTVTDLAKGTVVGTGNSSADTKITAVNTNYYGTIDASTFQPETEGLYIFRRNIKENEGTADSYEYSGYYFVPKQAASGENPEVPAHYFALHYATGDNGGSDYVLPDDAINDNTTATPSGDQVLPVTVNTGKVVLFQASEKVIDSGSAASNLQWTYNKPDSSKTTDLEKNGYFAVKYVGADGLSGATPGDTEDDIVINIALANIGTTGETWTQIGTANKTTFYYNNDVEAGDTTTKLVDSVALSDNTTQKSYITFDFDLNVFMESRQVTVDETGKELTTPVTPWNAATDGAATTANVNTGATTSGTAYTNSEIDTVGWTELT